MLIETRLQTGAFNRYKAFAKLYHTAGDTLTVVYRDAERHGITANAVMKVGRFDTDGSPLAAPQVIATPAGCDPRGAGGGITSAGTLLYYYRTERVSGTGPKYQLWCLRSTNDLATSTHHLINSSSTELIAPHGNMVQVGNKIMQGFNSYNPTTGVCNFILSHSFDDGLSHTLLTNPQNGPIPAGAQFTEPSLAEIGGGRVICVARDNSSRTTSPLFCITQDCNTWSSMVTIPNLITGQTGLALNYDPDTNIVLLTWLNRETLCWQYSMADADVLWSELLNQKNWRNQTNMPIFGTSQWDGGYGSIVKVAGTTYMTYYKGNPTPGQGADVFLVNMSNLLGGTV